MGLDASHVLRRWVRSGTTPQRLVLRSRIVLLALDGTSVEEIAERLGISTRTVKLWTSRFSRGGTGALLHDAPGRGRHASLDPATLQDRLRQVSLLRPDGQPVSLRLAAAFLEVSASCVWRTLRKTNQSASTHGGRS